MFSLKRIRLEETRMRATTDNSSRMFVQPCGIRQEEKSTPEKLEVKEIKRKIRRPENLDSMVPVAPGFERTGPHTLNPSKAKRRRKKKRKKNKSYITTRPEIQKHSCSDSEHDNKSVMFGEPQPRLAIEQEYHSGSIFHPSSTPRVLVSTAPRELQYPDTLEEVASTNQSLNGINSTRTPSHRISEPKLKDLLLPYIIHNIESTEDSQPISHILETLPHQSTAVDANIYTRSQSVPTIPSSRSQAHFDENGRRHSEPDHGHWKVPSFKSILPTVLEQKNQNSTWGHDINLSESIKNHSKDVLMEDFSAVNSPNMHGHFESSDRHAEDTSSTFELSMLYDQWQRISYMRSHISARRETLRVMRGKLRSLRDDKSLADDAYFREVKMRELNMPFPRPWWPRKTLEELVCDSQKARDEYGPLEDEYNNVENDLSSQEYQLSQQEEHFYSQLQDPSRFIFTPIDSEKAKGLPEKSENLKPHESHPLVEAYLSKLGKLDILRERYDEVLDEKLNLEEQLATRQRFDMILMPENQQWLDSSQAQLDNLSSEIQVTEEEERELRQQCFSMGLVDESGEPTETSILNQEGSTFSRCPDRFDSPREYVQISSLLPPEQSNIEINLEKSDSDHNYLARNERFDRWSLEKLQISLVEVDRYANCFNIRDEVRDLWKIKQETCKESFTTVWFTDGFTNNAPKSTGLSSYHSTLQYVPCTKSSCDEFPTSHLVLSKESSQSRSRNLGSSEEEAIACVLPLSDIVSTTITV
ncbi:hypothetical protein MFRU_018g01000 [Monilinia fructicola]|nr:hypothetical protein MFRU_018g01000 [Monilinia fructicola]